MQNHIIHLYILYTGDPFPQELFGSGKKKRLFEVSPLKIEAKML